MPVPSADLEHSLTPRQVVEALDRYIVGQDKAKRAVAIALRNRWRRQQVPAELRDEISPKNIIMIGPTGVGKTEIARRLAKLAEAPFIKVEATKYTEVGYVGKDVESMIRDLTETAVKMLKEQEKKVFSEKARESAEERLLDLLLPQNGDRTKQVVFPPAEGGAPTEPPIDQTNQTREKIREMFRKGLLDKRIVKIKRQESPLPGGIDIFAIPAFGDSEHNLKDIFDQIIPKKTRASNVTVPEAFKTLIEQEENRLVDMDKVVKNAVHRVENSGIIFLDEIDKVAGRESHAAGPQVSREGVQRDLLPIVEGSNVNTKYGVVKTDHILFIAAGAFNVSKPSDLIPELQGRFPIRVELDSLTKNDFVRILVEPDNSLTKQYTELLKTEGIEIQFDPSGIEAIAEIASTVNSQTENIGARRLHTIMERLFDDLAFDAPELKSKQVKISAEYVKTRLSDIVKDQDLSRYIL